MASGTTYTINNINLFDAALNNYGSLEELFHFITLNPSVNNVIYNFSANTSYNTDNYAIPTTTPNTVSAATPSTASTWTIAENQSIFDIALQFYGTLSNIVNLIITNPSLENVNFTNKQGTQIIVPNSNINNNTVLYYLKYSIIPTTNIGNPIPYSPPPVCISWSCGWSCGFGD
jgi:hypothetical protein